MGFYGGSGGGAALKTIAAAGPFAAGIYSTSTSASGLFPVPGLTLVQAAEAVGGVNVEVKFTDSSGQTYAVSKAGVNVSFSLADFAALFNAGGGIPSRPLTRMDVRFIDPAAAGATLTIAIAGAA